MATRMINWRTQRQPSVDEAKQVLTNFLGGAGTLAWDGMYTMTLPGKPTAALEGLAERVPEPQYGTRWIRVGLNHESMYVSTDGADEFTNALARRLAEIFATHWNGEIEQ